MILRPNLLLLAAASSASEGSAVTFAVTLDSAPTEAVVVNYVTADGSAGTSDYTAVSGTVTFQAGQTTQYVTIQTTEDTTFEEDETFSVTFSGSRLNASVQRLGQSLMMTPIPQLLQVHIHLRLPSILLQVLTVMTPLTRPLTTALPVLTLSLVAVVQIPSLPTSQLQVLFVSTPQVLSNSHLPTLVQL